MSLYWGGPDPNDPVVIIFNRIVTIAYVFLGILSDIIYRFYIVKESYNLLTHVIILIYGPILALVFGILKFINILIITNL